MQAPTINEALGVWERGSQMGQAGRGLALLGLGFPGTPQDGLADLSVGARDTALLSLREAMFGADIDGCANCPACGEMMEMNFSTRDLTGDAADTQPLSLDLDGYDITLRLLTTRDLLALDGSEDPRRALLSRCIVSARRGGEEAADLPAPVMAAAEQALANADPQADIKLSISCAACGHGWKAPFDIVSYLWTELDAWAVRMLRDVHVLATAYGWREADILALSPQRRKFYLEMAAP